MTTAQSDSALASLASRLGPARDRRLRWHDDPIGFCRDCVLWAPGEGLAGYQEAVLASLVTDGRVAVRSPHGAGKTSTAALAVLWHAITRDEAEIDWKCLCTAGSHRQLEKFLFPEIHQWAHRLRWDVIGRPPFDPRKEMFTSMLRLKHGELFAAASDRPELVEGAHASSVLVVLDEAKAIAPALFDALEGAFSGPGEIMALATSTPGGPSGRFYAIHQRQAGLTDWKTIHVTLKAAIKSGRVSREWAEARAAQWGKTSPIFLNRCLGEFAGSDEDGVIPLSWVEAAVDRWRTWVEAGQQSDQTAVLGVDVARGGGDQTCIAVRRGDIVTALHRYNVADTMQVTGHVLSKLGTGDVVVVDVIGIGSGVFDRLREQRGKGIIPFNASERATGKDRAGELEFLNRRSQAWWSMREALDPAFGAVLGLPDDDELVGDLCAPRWSINSSGRVQVEPKDEIRRRLGRSPDTGDAVVMTVGMATRPHRKARMVAGGRLPPGVSRVADSTSPVPDDPMIVSSRGSTRWR